MSTYFLTEQRIKESTTMLGNVDAKLFMPLIPAAADLFIQPRTGSYFFKDLLTKYNAETLNTKETELVALIQKSLMWRVISDFVLTSSAQLSNKGAQDQDGLNSNQSEYAKLGALMKHYNGKAEFYDARIIHFIWNNKASFPAFTNSLNMDYNVDLYPTKITPYNGIQFF